MRRSAALRCELATLLLAGLAEVACCEREEVVLVPHQERIAHPGERPFGGPSGDFETPWFTPHAAFDELIVSWNVVGEPFVVELRVTSEANAFGAALSPWLEIGAFGAVDLARERIVEFTGGKVEVDVFVASAGARYRAAQLRFKSASSCRLVRCDLGFTDRSTPLPPSSLSSPVGPPVAIPVPFLSQQSAPEAIRSRICSPTALAMVLLHLGRDVTPEGLAAEVFEPEHDLYGIWPRNVQVAFRHGVPGAVRRFADWGEVEATLRRGVPIIASIGVAVGQLDGAPYATTSGHLIVLRGLDEHGDILVNDPAAATAATGQRAYRRDQLTVCWLQRGGTAYVLGEEFGGSDAKH